VPHGLGLRIGYVSAPTFPRENPRVFSFFRAPEACDGGRGHGARASAEPERSGAPLPARIGHAIRLLGQCGAGRYAARHVTRGRRVTQTDYAGSDLRGMAMWWYR
jgi:hypothetical protein